MFTEIPMIDYGRPLAERRASRKVCGPYRWTPSAPMTGRAFYQASKGALAVDPRGSTFDLRLSEANEHLSDYGYGSRKRVLGYYIDAFQDETLVPIVARLPRGRGFLAGWTMGRGMLASLDAGIYDDASDAALAAHSIAERDAERERDYRDDEDAQDAQDGDDEGDDA